MEERLIEIDYVPRRQFIDYHDRTQRFACIVAHRRAGKTVACVNDLQRAAIDCRGIRPRFAYISPFLGQSKTIAWDYLKHAARPILRYGGKVNESELRVDYPNGGQVRLYGADNPNALRGIYLDGVVMDEFADMDPKVWSEVIRPALADRKGFATFIGTPKGRNEFHAIHKRSLEDPEWYSLVLKASETGLIPESELDLARRDLTDDQYAQEFECSFDAAIVGAYYGKQMSDADAAGRVSGVPYDPATQVWTAWDLGIADQTAIWFAQMVGREVHIIDYYEASGVDLGHYAREVLSKPYQYAGHIVPHDAQAKELGTGKTRLEVMGSLGLRNLTVAKVHRVEDGINAVRMFLPRCWFDAEKTKRGVEALRLYRSEFDDKLKVLRPRPLHDWTSHAADAMRYLAMTFDSRATDTSDFGKKLDYGKYGVV